MKRDDGESIAFVFGVSHFKISRSGREKDIPPIPRAADNVSTLSDLLADSFVWGAEIVAPKNPSSSDIVTTLESYERRRNESRYNYALLYVCSHGKPVRGNLHLYGSDTEGDFEDSTSLEYQKIRDAFLRVPAQRRIVIIDSCYSGLAATLTSDAKSYSEVIRDETIDAATQSTSSSDLDDRRLDHGSGNFVILSSNSGQPSDDANKDGTYTAFTGALIEAIKTGDSTRPSRKLSLDDLAEASWKILRQDGHPDPVWKGTNGFEKQPLIGNLASAPQTQAATEKLSQADQAEHDGRRSSDEEREDWLSRLFYSGAFSRNVFLLSAFVSTIATYSGLLTFLGVDLISGELSNNDIISSTALLIFVIALTLSMMLIVNSLAKSVRGVAMVALLMAYLTTVVFSVGFGYAFYWRVLSAQIASDFALRDAASTLESSVRSFETEIVSFKDRLEAVRLFSESRMEQESVSGGSCDGDDSPPGFGPRARERQRHTERVAILINAIESDWVVPTIGETAEIIGKFDEFRVSAGNRDIELAFSEINLLENSLGEFVNRQNGILSTRKETYATEVNFVARELRTNTACQDKELASRIRSAGEALTEISPLRTQKIEIPRGSEAVSSALQHFWSSLASIMPLGIEATRPFRFHDFLALFVAVMVDLSLLVSGWAFTSHSRRGK